MWLDGGGLPWWFLAWLACTRRRGARALAYFFASRRGVFQYGLLHLGHTFGS